MIGQYKPEHDSRTCIWIAFERSQKEWVSLCQPSSPIPKEDIVLADDGCNCKMCLCIAAQIVEDAKELEK